MNNTFRFTFFGLAFLLGACREDIETPASPSSSKEFLSFGFLSENNPEYLTKDYFFSVNGSHINLMFPPGQTVDSLIATFTSSTDSVMVDSIQQKSDTTINNFSDSVVYTLVAEDSTIKTYQVKPRVFAGVPILYIDTEGQAPITSKDDYVDGELTLIANGSGEEPLTKVDMEIRGRGNTTWQMPKKPYRIKLDGKTEMLGMSADKSWVLLANFSDKTLMRNHIAFEFSRRFGLAYTPRSRFVEVYLNGSYNGNYLLTEQIQIDEHRLNIDELDKNDIEEDLISGGYLLEIDGRRDDDHWFRSGKNIPFTIKSPDKIADDQLEYIKSYIQTAEDAIFSDSFTDPQQGYTKYIDVESFVNWYLVNEITKNNDAAFGNSVFLHKPRDGKLFMGPVWDFDIAMGNINYSDAKNAEGWHIRKASWFSRLFEDPAFRQKIKARWNLFKDNEIKATLAEIDNTSAYLQESQTQNFKRWKILHKTVWPNPVVTGSYEDEVKYMKDWLIKRIEWMDQAVNSL
ncbi:MAG: CotH kinase family protein [Bacteroidota bacterium]